MGAPHVWYTSKEITLLLSEPNLDGTAEEICVLLSNIAEEDSLFHICEVNCVSGIDHVSSALSLSASIAQTIASSKTTRLPPRKVRNSSMTRVLSNAMDIVDNVKSVLTRSPSRSKS